MLDTCNWGVDTYALRAEAGRLETGWSREAGSTIIPFTLRPYLEGSCPEPPMRSIVRVLTCLCAARSMKGHVTDCLLLNDTLAIFIPVLTLHGSPATPVTGEIQVSVEAAQRSAARTGLSCFRYRKRHDRNIVSQD